MARNRGPARTGSASGRGTGFLLTGVLAAGVLVVGCAGGSSTHHAATTTTTSTTTVTTTGGPTPTADCTTPTLASRSILAGWAARDRAITGTCSTVTVVNDLFAYRGSPAGATLQSCGGPDPGVPVCTFTYSGGTGHLTFQGDEAAGWRAQTVQLAGP